MDSPKVTIYELTGLFQVIAELIGIYAQHLPGCVGASDPERYECTCGYDKAMRELARYVKEEEPTMNHDDLLRAEQRALTPPEPRERLLTDEEISELVEELLDGMEDQLSEMMYPRPWSDVTTARAIELVLDEALQRVRNAAKYGERD